MKPQAKLYEVVERMTKRRREQMLYIDDRPENIAAGAARGWQTILQETPEKTLAAVEKQTGSAWDLLPRIAAYAVRLGAA